MAASDHVAVQFQEGPQLARAKSTARAEARRRNRVMQANELSEGTADPNVIATAASGTSGSASAAMPPRRGFFGFRMPNIRADLPTLPNELLTNRWIWLAAALLVSALVLFLVRDSVPTSLTPYVLIYVQLMVTPPALPVLLGGFVARRAPYLVGLALGILNGIVYAVLVSSAAAATTPAQVGGTTVYGAAVTLDPVAAFLNATVMGTLFGGIAGWYRRFLSENNARTKAARQARDVEKARKAKQDARAARSAK
ncbi:MAG: hypothetical protein ACRDF7_05730 [Candidatus Limnocylindrales bacterium]